jgi:hypothetical protein
MVMIPSSHAARAVGQVVEITLTERSLDEDEWIMRSNEQVPAPLQGKNRKIH